MFQEEIKHPPGQQQTFGESRFFIGDVDIALGSHACSEIVLLFWESIALLGRNFEFTKTPREPFLAASDSCLARLRPHTPHQERPSISLAVAACKEL